MDKNITLKLPTKLKSVLQHLYNADIGLKVGILEGATKVDGDDKNSATVAEYAFWNEFGTKHLPPRPFLRRSIAKNSGDWADVFAETVDGKALQKDILKTALGRVGVSAVADIQQGIEENKFKPNAPSTLKRKGEHKIPLKDTGTLFNAISSQVTDTKGEK